MAQFIVNKSGTVHSIPDGWLAEKLASGYRLAEQGEIDAHYAGQGLKDAPKVGALSKDYAAYLQSVEEASLVQSTTIGPRPGDVDVRLAQPGEPGFAIGVDGMRQVPSRITTQSLNPTGAAGSGEGVSEQDGHVYEVVVPQVAEAAISRAPAVPVEVSGAMQAVQQGNEPSNTPSSPDGPTPISEGITPPSAGADGGNTAGDRAAADAAKAKADSKK